MQTIVTILGARPQFIKAAPLSCAFLENANITEILVHTGQHYDIKMSDIFFRQLKIHSPNYNLGIAGGGHGVMVGAMLQALEPLLQKIRPDLVLVYGDTNSTLAGALTAAKLHIPVAHVEAGLRSFNRRMPEEHNRVLADHLADLLFTPTDTATENLQREGISKSQIYQTGDVMFDATLSFIDQAKARSKVLEKHGLNKGQYVLATVHRAENTDVRSRLLAIMEGLDEVARELPVVFPLHPRTRVALEKEGIEPRYIQFLKPVGYLDILMLEANAAVIATDSGGMQKEAYFQRVPCVTLRDETEWVELVEHGWNRLAPPGSVDLKTQILSARNSFGKNFKLYGDGRAAKKIAHIIRFYKR